MGLHCLSLHFHSVASAARRSRACSPRRCAEEGGLSRSGTAAELGAGRRSAWHSGGRSFQQGRKVEDGHQLLLSNLTFETSSNFSCRVMAPSVPGLEQSKQVAVTVQGKNRRVCGCDTPPE